MYHARKAHALPSGCACNKCGAALTPENWRGGLWRIRHNICRTCRAIQERATYQRTAKPLRDRIRAEMLAAYGGRCVCCGETEPQFLGIDHIHGGGARHRRALGAGVHFYRHLRVAGYPRDAYQLLCHNCNQAKGLYGSCPHAERKHRHACSA